MSSHKKFQQNAAKAYEEAEKLEKQASEFMSQAAAKRAQGDTWSEAIKLLEKDLTPSSSRKKKESLRPGSDVEKAYNYLVKVGKAVRIEEIVSGIGKGPDKDTKVSLGSQIQAYARGERLFVKTAPNTFGLIEYPEPEVGLFDEIEENPLD